ncbi:MAG: hypothetical protein J5548_14740 [Prevotella sp.]|nr:hypothetical protein [Prevotella sp.]
MKIKDKYSTMMRKQVLSIIAIVVLCITLGACKKEREVDVNKLKDIFIEGISKELAEDGKTLVVDTFYLNPVNNYDYAGKLYGHVNDSLKLSYILSVKEDGDDLDVEWELETPVVKPVEEDSEE